MRSPGMWEAAGQTQPGLTGLRMHRLFVLLSFCSWRSTLLSWCSPEYTKGACAHIMSYNGESKVTHSWLLSFLGSHSSQACQPSCVDTGFQEEMFKFASIFLERGQLVVLMLSWEGYVVRWRDLSRCSCFCPQHIHPCLPAHGLATTFHFLREQPGILHGSLSTNFLQMWMWANLTCISSPLLQHQWLVVFSASLTPVVVRQALIFSAHCQRPLRLMGIDRCGERSPLTSSLANVSVYGHS